MHKKSLVLLLVTKENRELNIKKNKLRTTLALHETLLGNPNKVKALTKPLQPSPVLSWMNEYVWIDILP